MVLLAQLELATVLFLSGLVLTCGVLLFRTHRQLGARPKTELPSPATFSQAKPKTDSAHHLDAPRDLQRWEVEMHELARELQAQLDNKISILQQLLCDAGQQADRLEAAVERAAEIGHAPVAIGPNVIPESSAQICTTRVDAAATRAGNLASRRHAEIYSMADQGLTSAAIAGRVGSPVGEIELILGLRAKQWS